MSDTEEFLSVVNSNPAFPEESDIKKYFTSETWDSMAEYEKLAHRNMFHNYTMMVTLGLKPVKPSFMSCQEAQVAAIERKNNTISSLLLPKKANFEDTSNLKISTLDMVKARKDKANKTVEVFSLMHKTLSIRLKNIFNGVFEAYKQYKRGRKTTHLRNTLCLKRKKKLISRKLKKTSEEKSETEWTNINVKQTFEVKHITGKGNKQSELIGKQINSARNKKHCKSCKAIKSKVKGKMYECLGNEISEKTEATQPISSSHKSSRPKKPRRSIQTQTLSPGQSLLTSDLVFVSTLKTKKLGKSMVAESNTKPVQDSKLGEKKTKLLNKRKMKNWRYVQTQTADDNSSIEYSDLVFFSISKTKLKKSKKIQTQGSTENDKSKNKISLKKKIVQTITINQETDQIEKITSVDLEEDDFEFPSSQESERRYPKRNVPRLNYTESKLLQDDDYIFCDACDREYEGDCPEHGPHTILPDNYVPITGEENRAELTTPPILHVAQSMIPGAGCGVWTTVALPIHTRFGPYQGEKSDKPDPLGYSWTIMKDRKIDHYVTAHSSTTSNWMRYVNCARHKSEQNLMAFQYKGQMYYRTVKAVPPKSELFVWYGKEYGEKLGISTQSFRNPDTSHVRNLVFSCDTCDTTYTSPLYLEKHKKKCGSRKAVGVRVVEAGGVPMDIQSLARLCDGRKTYFCNLCSYTTYQTTRIKRHVMIHTGEKRYQCEVCDKAFSLRQHLDYHKVIHTGVKELKCPHCTYRTNLTFALNTHMTTHTGEKPFACTYCNYRASDRGNIKRHIRSHSGETPYKCDVCDKAFSLRQNLNVHKAIHTGVKRFKCPHCTYRCNQRSNLNTHMTTHTGEKPFECTYCNYRTSTSGNMKKHVRTHTGERPYKCDICGKSFTWPQCLNDHKAIHTGVKRLKCPHCTYRCNRRSDLNKHMTTHTGEKQYACTYCNYRTSRSDDMKKHVRTHTGERPYKCTQCPYKATEQSAITAHIKRVHNKCRPVPPTTPD